MTSRPGFYLAITMLALLAALVLALQVVGALFKLGLIVAVFAVAFAAVRSWLRSQER